jgi:hypothetical protein
MLRYVSCKSMRCHISPGSHIDLILEKDIDNMALIFLKGVISRDDLLVHALEHSHCNNCRRGKNTGVAMAVVATLVFPE